MRLFVLYCINVLVINCSPIKEHVPDGFKTAVVTLPPPSFINKASLPFDDIKNYNPVS